MNTSLLTDDSTQLDIRLQHLSYSSLLTLHQCPRKFFLTKCNAEQQDTDTDGTQSLTFAFGHCVGTGIQLLLQNNSIEHVIWESYKNWPIDMALVNDKQNKSFYAAMVALFKFEAMRNSIFKDYELLNYNGQPAVELSFCITLPDGFKYRGYVDAVLRHKITGEIVVLECKTTSSTNLNSAQYKNSAQAIGYSIVLDVIAPEVSSYRVYYLPYKTKSAEYETFTFPKSYLQRALWIQELLLDIEDIKRYHEVGMYPMRGESCYSYYRECEFFNTCTLSDKYLISPLSQEAQDKMIEDENSKYQITLTLNDLIEAQIAKAQNIEQKSNYLPAPPSSDGLELL